MPESQQSYRSILKATSLVGGVSVINIPRDMMRVKYIDGLLVTTSVGLNENDEGYV